MMKKKGMTKSETLGNSEKEKASWGRGQMANMPQEVEMSHYKKPSEYGPTDLDDTITHIDSTNMKAHTTARRFLSNQH